MNIQYKRWIIALLIFIGASANESDGISSEDLTVFLEPLGNPFAAYYKDNKKLYARNVWDMIPFKGKLYLGAGNSSNEGPAVNPGAAPVVCYDVETGSFEYKYITAEEQIDVLYVLNDTLIIPGHDPRESWDFGNIYLSKDGNEWLKNRTIPNAIHIYSLSYYQDKLFDHKLFAALATAKGAVVAMSEDFGESWSLSPPHKGVGRFYEFLQVEGLLYVTGTILENAYRREVETRSGVAIDELFQYTEVAGFIHRVDMNSTVLFPDTVFDKKRLAKITRACTFNNKAIYIGAYLHNDHQSIPFGLYVANSLQQGHVDINKVNLPEDTTPWDIIENDGYIYVLANKIDQDKIERSLVLRSADLEAWEELFFFDPPGLMRSFAIYDNVFYFSLGSEVVDSETGAFTELHPETGMLMRLHYGRAL